jgi:hypothetical protein
MCPYRDERLELRLSERDLTELDRRRGSTTRSAYLRWLIHHGPVEPAVLDGDVTPDVTIQKMSAGQSSVTEPRPVDDPVQPVPPTPSPIGPPVPPDPPVETKNRADVGPHEVYRHGHSWVKDNSLLDRCTECGETRAHQLGTH